MKNFCLCLFIALFAVNVDAQKKIAFIGQAPAYNTLITDSDGFIYNDDYQAAVWFMETFLSNHSDISGSYFSFEDIADGDETILDDFDVIWVQYDGGTYTARMWEWPRGITEEITGVSYTHCNLKESGFEWNGQCDTLEDNFMAKLRSFYESGKNIFLGNFAGRALEVIGVFDDFDNPWELRPNNLFGYTHKDTDYIFTGENWGTNWNAGKDNPLKNGITTATNTNCSSKTKIDFLSSDFEKLNRTLQYNLNYSADYENRIYNDANTANGGSSTLEQRRDYFETTLGAHILMDNCDGNEIHGVQFNPKTSGKGMIIWYGSGVYDWYGNGAGSNDNVKNITENALLYLLNPTATWYTDTDDNTDKWDNLKGPNFGINAYIKANYTTSSELNAKTLTIGEDGNTTLNENSSFVISSENPVTVTGKITNYAAAANFVVENDAGLVQTGSTSNTGSITVNRFTQFANPTNKYLFWSSPVQGQNMYGIFKTGTPQY
ncbi:MAG: DUF4960 domain-containing protein, partial [Bergeyella sp.]